MSELLPCPFCGKTPNCSSASGEEGKISICFECPDGCSVSKAMPTHDEAVGAWNARRIFWQPIASAPKDGTEILAFAVCDGKPVIDVTWWRQEKDKKGFVRWGEFNSTYWPATHWMPLPPAPEAQP